MTKKVLWTNNIYINIPFYIKKKYDPSIFFHTLGYNFALKSTNIHTYTCTLYHNSSKYVCKRNMHQPVRNEEIAIEPKKKKTM